MDIFLSVYYLNLIGRQKNHTLIELLLSWTQDYLKQENYKENIIFRFV